MSKDGILSNRARNYAADELKQFTDSYELVNNDQRVSYKAREKAIKRVRKAVERLREGKISKKDFNIEGLCLYGPAIEQDAISYENKRKNDDMMSEVLDLDYE
jgi:predicted phage gp36 major capsid-like protein